MSFPMPRYMENLRQASWLTVLRNAWLVLLAGLAVKLMLPDAAHDLVRPLLLVAPLLPLVAKDLSHLPDAIERSRAACAAGQWGRLCAAWLPPELVGLLRLGRAQRRGFVHWLLRRPVPALPAGQALTYLERGAYRTMFAIVIFGLLVELPLDTVMLSVLPLDPERRGILHLVMLAGGLSTLVWIVGDRWLVGAGCHVVDSERLLLRIGARTTGAVPVAAIADCARISESPARWCARQGIDVRRTLTVSPFDKPNTVLILKKDCHVHLEHLGRERRGFDCLFLYLDRPDMLASTLSTIVPKSN